MANNLSSTISLTDNFTPQLRNISNAISTISATLNSVDFDGAFDPSSCKSMMSAAQALDKSIGDLEKESKSAAQEQDRHNRTLKEGQSAADSLSNGFKGLVGAIGGVVATYAGIEGIKSALNWSDEITQTTSRLNLVNDAFNEINGSAQTTKELQDKIFQAAQDSRGSYQDLENLVASLGNNARDAFSSTDEMVTFAENLNKTFAISGASADEMSNATLQLTQGLAAGALRGDELNSVLENAPELINVIANSMGVPRGQIRDLAADGQITAEVVKNALIGSSDEINAKFESMDVTFSQLWTQFTNAAQHAFEPVSQALSGLASNPEFQESLNTLSLTIEQLAPKIADFVSSVVGAAPTVITGIVNGLSWLVDNGEQVGYILSIIGGAFLAYQTYSFVSGVIMAINAALTETGVAGAAAGAGMSLALGPIGLIIAAVGALVAGVVYLWNTNEGFRDAVIGIWNSIVGAFQNAWNNISGIFTALSGGWDTVLQSVQNFWTNLQNTVSGWWNAAYEWGMNLIQGFINGMGSIWNNVVTWINDNFGWIIDNVKSVFGIASPSTVFSDIGSNLLQGFWDGMVSIWNGVTQWATDAWNWITDIFSGGGQEEDAQIVDYTAQIEATRAQLAQLQEEVRAGYAQILQIVADSNMAIVAQGVTMFSSMTGTVIADSATMVGGINANISQIPGLLGASLANVLPVAQMYFAMLQEQTALQIGQLVLQMGNSLAALLPVVQGYLGQLQALMLQQIQGLIEQTNAALLGLMPIFEAVLNDLRTKAVQLFTSLSEAAIGVITTMSDSVITGINAMSLAVLSLLENLRLNYIATWTNLSNSTLEILNILTSRAQTATQQLVNGVKGIIDTMPGIFRTSADNAMASFIDGINSSTAGAVDATNQLVAAVKDAFVKGLGIHSPSDETYWYGQMTGLGFIEGLSDSELVQFAKGILNEIVDAFVNGTFNADELVDFLGEDSLKVIDAIQRDPELMERAGIPGGGSSTSIVEAARKYVNYISPWGNNNSMFNQRLGLGAGAWCAMFVKAMADEAGVFFPALYSVPAIYDWAHQNGKWSTTPQIGDAVIFGSGKGHHIEIVSGIPGNGEIQSIGGNTGIPPGVYEHKRGDILGYVRLDGSVAGVGGTETIAYPLIGTRGSQTSWFGPRASPGGIGSTNHGGIDLAAPTGTPIASALAGSVTQAGWNGGYGQSVTVNSGAIDILYGHMSAVQAQQGQSVGKGQQIGLVGSTGWSTGAHLHFEMHQNGQRIDPQPYIDGGTISAGGGGASLISMIQSAYDRKYGTNLSGGAAAYNPSAGVAQWATQVQTALTMLGQPLSLTNDVLYAIECESSGDPKSINLDDRNAREGHPSQGLLQTIPDTFNSYRNPSLSSDITDPLANIYAGLNYMIHRYGSIQNVVNPRRGGWYGYATGTPAATPGIRWVGENGPELVAFNGGERVFTNQESRAFVEGRTSGNSNTTNAVNNTPVTVSVNIGTINNNEDLDFTLDKFEDMFCEVIDNVIYNEPRGMAAG